MSKQPEATRRKRQQETCRCERLKYPHRLDAECRALAAEDGRTAEDDRLDDPRRESRMAMPTIDDLEN